MPFLNGIEICRSIRSNERWYQLPVIFLSVYNDTETINRLFLAGADDYVSKPFVGPELVTRISNRLARSGTNVVQEGSDELDSRTRNVAKIRAYLEQASRDQTQISLAARRGRQTLQIGSRSSAKSDRRQDYGARSAGD